MEHVRLFANERWGIASFGEGNVAVAQMAVVQALRSEGFAVRGGGLRVRGSDPKTFLQVQTHFFRQGLIR